MPTGWLTIEPYTSSREITRNVSRHARKLLRRVEICEQITRSLPSKLLLQTHIAELTYRAFGRIGSAYQKLGDLEQAVKYFHKSLTEHRTPDILTKLRETEKAKLEADKQAYIDPVKGDAAREEGNTFFKVSLELGIPLMSGWRFRCCRQIIYRGHQATARQPSKSQQPS
jgi:tetratricopeptide (TPR) repeat protein